VKQRIARLSIGVILILLSTPLVTGHIARAQGRCWPPSIGYGGACYYPSQVSQAERSLRFRAVRPTAAVTYASWLQLYRVVVTPIAGPNQSTLPGGWIVYVYGRLPSKVIDLRLTPKTTPKFVMVVETLGHDNFANQVTLGRVYTAKWHAYGPWWFVAVGGIPGVALQVLSNLTKSQVGQIGRGILAAATGNK